MLFYTQLFTSKRGPLAKIWLAAHWERKLTKAHVFECNLETTIRDIISPKMNVGLRTSGHLLIGLVRIYSRKAKYLLADCNDALCKINISFRPGQMDLSIEGLEATVKEITLTEDFTAFDVELPNPCDLDVVDHFSLNQSRTEEITLKEDFGNSFLTLVDFGAESLGPSSTILDKSFDVFTQQGDAFGDEDRGLDFLDFLENSGDPTDLLTEEQPNQNPDDCATDDHQHAKDAGRRDPPEAKTPTPNVTTLIADEEFAFALEPVAITPNSERRIGKRKRKLVVDQTKELSDDFIKNQLADSSDLVAPLDMAPPTVQFMLWKENGSVDKLFSQSCSSMVHPELFAKIVPKLTYPVISDEPEEMRQERKRNRRDHSNLHSDVSTLDLSMTSDKTPHAEVMAAEGSTNQHEGYSEQQSNEEDRSELTHLDVPSEDSLFVHPSLVEPESQVTSLCTQSLLSSQDFEERRITRRAQRLLDALKRSHSSSSGGGSEPSFSLESLCKGSHRSQAAGIFFCLLVLKKQQAVELHQSAPYQDILITPGPNF